jgi:hypothetical protein
MKKAFLLNVLLNTPLLLHPGQAPMPQPAPPDYGFLWRDGAERPRPKAHLTHDKIQQVAFQNIPTNTVITAEIDDPRDPNQQESRIVLVQENGNLWSLDFAIIQPTTINYPTKELAQQHALAFLTQPSAERKQQEREEEAKRKQEKRQRMKYDKYRLGRKRG